MKKNLIGKYALIFVCSLSAACMACGQAGQNGQLLSRQPRTLLHPAAANCTIGLLDLRITTGDDDLRGGQDNLDVEVHYVNGDMQTASNVNKGQNWPNRSVNVVAVQLNRPVAPDQIKQIRLVHVRTASSGSHSPNPQQIVGEASPAGPAIVAINAIESAKSEDNWDMASLQAFGLAGGANVPIGAYGFHRFTGSDPSLDINVHPGAGCPTGKQVTRLAFTFKTSDDDLRGGNDNLNVTILFADGSSQSEPNINHSQNWPNGSTKGAEIFLNHPVDISQIRSIRLEDTFGGGSGGDNWNMASMQADASLADGTNHTVAKFGFHRFSADVSGPKARQITIPASPIN